MAELRKEFERLHQVPDYLRWKPTHYAVKGNSYEYEACRMYNALWQGFQSGHAAGLEQQAKRIAELEASLADSDEALHLMRLTDSNEALQVLGLKLAHAEADSVRLDWLEDNSYALPYKDHGAGPELDLSRPAIDALMTAHAREIEADMWLFMANCSNEDTRTTGESASTSDE